MNVFSFVTALVAMYLVYELGSKWLEARRHRPEELQKMDRVVEDLRERVETLERIVTDQRETLKRKFDEL